MSIAAEREKVRVARMLRTLRRGDRVVATIHCSTSTEPGELGTVVDPSPFRLSDSERRIRVQWDGRSQTVLVLPSSIEVQS